MKNKNKQSIDQLPTVLESLEKLITPNTVLVYPEKEIIFENNKLSPVKSLKVNICSIETQDMAILHRLHTQTRAEQ